jgi:enoyl-CoA hydratase
MESARALARDIARNTPFGVRMTKQVLRRNLDASLEDALELENRTQILATRSAHSHEALAAFIEGRDPGFASFTPMS